MTEEEYDQREGTLRDYARKKREEDPNFKFFPKDNQGLKEEERQIIYNCFLYFIFWGWW